MPCFSNGIKSNRDPWVYNFNRLNVEQNMETTISIYNQQLEKFKKASEKNPNLSSVEFIDYDNRMITWTREIKWDFEKRKSHKYIPSCLTVGMYRPFMKQNYYFNKDWNNTLYQIPKLFPDSKLRNTIICTSYSATGFSTLATNLIPDLHLIGDSQCFSLFYYEKQEKQNRSLFDDKDGEYVRRDGVSDFILERAKTQYGRNVGKEDIFYYVYGFLHSPEYKIMFANDLKKMLPRLPLVEDVRDFWKFSKAGRALAELHINYETVPAYEDVKVTGADSGFYTVEKMRFPKKDQKDTIIYNSKITIENIPAKAYDYVVNGKSAIEWIMERYKVAVDLNSKGEGSGIKNDPNDWATEVGNPRYILDLLLSVINVSVQTVDIIAGLPKVTFQ